MRPSRMPNPDGRELAAIFLGGAAGGLLRVWLGETFTTTATAWPWATFVIWMLESQRLAEDADGNGALLNILLSLAVGVGAAALGHAIGAHL